MISRRSLHSVSDKGGNQQIMEDEQLDFGESGVWLGDRGDRRSNSQVLW